MTSLRAIFRITCVTRSHFSKLLIKSWTMPASGRDKISSLTAKSVNGSFKSSMRSNADCSSSATTVASAPHKFVTTRLLEFPGASSNLEYYVHTDTFVSGALQENSHFKILAHLTRPPVKGPVKIFLPDSEQCLLDFILFIIRLCCRHMF